MGMDKLVNNFCKLKAQCFHNLQSAVSERDFEMGDTSPQYLHVTTRLKFHFFPSGPPSVPTLSCVGLSGDVSGAVNVTVSWTLSGGDSADFYLINITTNAPQTPYGGLLNITTASVTQYELTGFMAGYEYNITVCGVNCGGQEGSESEPLTTSPQGMY